MFEQSKLQCLWHGGMIDAEIEGGQVTKRYIFINLRAVAVIEYENDSTSGNKSAGYNSKNAPKSTAIYAIHTDHLGTPQAITDSQQAVVWRADYATFGRATVQARVVDGSSKTAKTSFGIISSANAANEKEAKPFEFNLRFAGQYEDTESGYHYNWHRYYDPSTGRYLTPDPIGLAGGLNGYGYAGQDPMASVDPSGLNCTTIGNNVTCDSPYLNGPHITFPKPPYSPDMVWPDSIDPSNSWYHKYDKQPSISTGTCTSKELMQGVIKKPTPGIFSQPASVQGTPNFATPTPLDILTLPIGSINPVISYITKDNNNPNISWVVNVTQPGHALFPGYVARGVVNTATGVEMHTYGEGVGFLQSPEAPSRVSNTINNAWIGLSNDVITNAKCGCSK